MHDFASECPDLFNTDMSSDIVYRAHLESNGLFVSSSCFEDDHLVGKVTYGPLVPISNEEATRVRLDLWGEESTPFQEGEVFEAIIDELQVILAMLGGMFFRGLETGDED